MTGPRIFARVEAERFELASPFRISRGEKTHAEVVTVALQDPAGRRVMAECVPYARYGESVAGVLSGLRALVPRETDEAALVEALDRLSGAARNALETALFALDAPARCAGALADFDARRGAGTIVVDTPERMAHAARAFDAAILKIKLSGDGLDEERLRRVHAARPELPLWLDANEGLSEATFSSLLVRTAERSFLDRVVLVEQPFAAGSEPARGFASSALPVCADESFHTAADVERVARAGYHAVNVKLDKAGGIRAALEAARAASRAGLAIVVGCMVSSSLSIAPAWLLVKALREEGVDVPFVDLDGATFLRADRSLAATGFA